MYTLLYSIQIINRDLLYSTWNSTQCVCQPGWEKASGKVGTCLWVDECFPCSPETTIALLIGCTPIPNKKFQVKFAKNIKQKKIMPQERTIDILIEECLCHCSGNYFKHFEIFAGLILEVSKVKNI